MTEKMTACVTGAAGYMASWLVKRLLEKGYAVNATVRNPDNVEKVSHLLALLGAKDRLKLFRADLLADSSYDAAIDGCDVVFHTATPINFQSPNPEKDMIEPAIEGTLNVLKSCAKTKTVKRVILTSSGAAVSINKNQEMGQVMDETCWTETDFLFSEKPPTWGYPASKALAEKAAWEFAKENNVNLYAIIPVLMAGRSLTPEVPSSVQLAMAPLTGNEFLMMGQKGMQMLSGSISLVHVDDVCSAQIFLAEKESVAPERYICCPINTSVVELATFLSKKYPQFKVPTDFGDFPTKARLVISSKKLVGAGFNFKYGIEEIYDESIEYFRSVGLLAK
ncbi:hypothetical protein AMTRI_Chr02g216580 [Amborella trichopoda]|uniref:NAD-dependent epimerase/dehydratase domain-containing protein n=1 Tax=Amborella trichopoda TaxID=13333 RepID=W1NW57_AMBTC|nr:anthocyanidin reductase ((2S)-flavan-3-ol-forming) [Amborella trichopoda]ERM99847.1 hypothetical protein AMTR_s00098p00115100 [Amborella trichopoda]|eukprot:XP_006836994.1 anthocyanidin reductase ((2S)-flavan-3-ol-forming) [Amborella trichopoda]